MSGVGIKLQGGMQFEGGSTISSTSGGGGGTYTVPFPDGVGAPGNYVYTNLSNANVAALEGLGSTIIGWTVTAVDNPTLTGTITLLDPVGHFGFRVSPPISYAVGRTFRIQP